MTPTEIANRIAAALTEGHEDHAIPRAVLTYADAHAGKPLTLRDVKALSEVHKIPFRIVKRRGMTSMEWGRYGVGGMVAPRGDLLIAYGERNVKWPTADALRTLGCNGVYFHAADQRNAARAAALAAPEKIARAAELAATIRAARAELEALIAYGEPLAQVDNLIESLAGLKD